MKMAHSSLHPGLPKKHQFFSHSILKKKDEIIRKKSLASVILYLEIQPHNLNSFVLVL